MNFIKRAFLSTKARMGKTLLMTFIFSLVSVLVLSGIAIQSASKQSGELARKKLGATVTLQVDREKQMKKQQEEQASSTSENSTNTQPRIRFQSTPIPLKSAKVLLELGNLKGYNFLSTTSAMADDFDPVESTTSDDSTSTTSTTENTQQPNDKGFGGMGRIQADLSVQGVTFTKAATTFTEGNATLTKGRHLTDEDTDKRVAVIEKTLAKNNDLQVGDNITISSPNDENTKVTLKIVGLYENNSTSSQGMNNAFLNPYNQIYVPYTVANTLKGSDSKDTVESAVYYMQDPADIDTFVAKAKASKSIDFDTFKVDANDDLYNQMVGPINNVASFSTTVVYIVTIAGAAILGLIVMMSIRERKYEIGVLLAIGEKKSKMVGQLLIEILLVAVVSVAISIGSGNFVAEKVSNQLLQQELAQNEDTSTQTNPFGSSGHGGPGGMGMRGMSQQTQQVETIDDLHVHISQSDIGHLAIIGLLIALISTLLPALSILRLQPKTILTKQD